MPEPRLEPPEPCWGTCDWCPRELGEFDEGEVVRGALLCSDCAYRDSIGEELDELEERDTQDLLGEVLSRLSRAAGRQVQVHFLAGWQERPRPEAERQAAALASDLGGKVVDRGTSPSDSRYGTLAVEAPDKAVSCSVYYEAAVCPACGGTGRCGDHAAAPTAGTVSAR